MRKIIFRGKWVDNGEWVEGSLIVWSDGSYSIEPGRLEVALLAVVGSTVGQFTGLTDKHGKRIFEGDIVRFKWDKYSAHYRFIEFANGEFCATPVLETRDEWPIRICGENENFVVIGNVHDNPELLEGGANDG